MRRTRTPKYRLHRKSGLAVVTLNGRDIYLGKHGTRSSREQYDRVIAEWLANGRRLTHGATDDQWTVGDLCERYEEFAATYYRRLDGTQTHEVTNVKVTLKPVRELYGSLPVGEFPE